MKYEKPEMVVLELEVEDVVTTSDEGGVLDTNETVW